jgi:hypothetical protein
LASEELGDLKGSLDDFFSPSNSNDNKVLISMIKKPSNETIFCSNVQHEEKEEEYNIVEEDEE